MFFKDKSLLFFKFTAIFFKYTLNILDNTFFKNTMWTLIISIIILITSSVGVYVFIINKKEKPVIDESAKAEENNQENEAKEPSVDPKLSKKKKKQQQVQERKPKEKFTDPDLLTSLKGHGGAVTDMDFSSSGKYLLSTADDRSIFFWSTKTFAQKEHKSVRYNMEFDSAPQAKWTPNSRAFMACQTRKDAVQVFKVGRREDAFPGNVEVMPPFPSKQHETEILSIGISCRFVMSCDQATTIIIWSPKGEVLHKINTHQGNHYYGVVSPCGRFVASCGFTPEVKVWEVNFNKTGDFQDVTRAFVLAGHRSSVYRCVFNNDSSRMASISKDMTWKLWDTNVEYRKGQEPRLLLSGPITPGTNPQSCQLALSSDGRTIAISEGLDLVWISGVDGSRVHTVPQPFANTAPTSLLFSPNGLWLLAGGLKTIHVFNNVWGYRNTIKGLEVARTTATSQASTSRLDARIIEAKKILETLSSPSKE